MSLRALAARVADSFGIQRVVNVAPNSFAILFLQFMSLIRKIMPVRWLSPRGGDRALWEGGVPVLVRKRAAVPHLRG